jgi:hypothetical protein
VLPVLPVEMDLSDSTVIKEKMGLLVHLVLLVHEVQMAHEVQMVLLVKMAPKVSKGQ